MVSWGFHNHPLSKERLPVQSPNKRIGRSIFSAGINLALQKPRWILQTKREIHPLSCHVLLGRPPCGPLLGFRTHAARFAVCVQSGAFKEGLRKPETKQNPVKCLNEILDLAVKISEVAKGPKAHVAGVVVRVIDALLMAGGNGLGDPKA